MTLVAFLVCFVDFTDEKNNSEVKDNGKNYLQMQTMRSLLKEEKNNKKLKQTNQANKQKNKPKQTKPPQTKQKIPSPNP